MGEHVTGCEYVASCLGHNLTFKGMYGHPRWLCVDATRRLCKAIDTANKSSQVQGKFILMNTNGAKDPSDPPFSFGARFGIGLLSLCVPPVKDNIRAANYLRKKAKTDCPSVDWVIVRPGNLIS